MSGDYSIYTGQRKTFSVPDYVVFGVTLVASAGIGLFYAIKDRKRASSDEYLMGGRKMYILPVAMSLTATFLSALTLLGTPAEIYLNATMFWWICLAFIIAIVISTQIFIPFFYKLNLTSMFEYLELRFSKPVRILASVIFVIQTIVYMSFVLYAPSLALNQVTGFSLWGSVVAVGGVVTLYTTLGGMKAVLWTDTLQALIMFAGLFAVLIQGSIVMGGFQNAWDIAGNRARIHFHDFSFDPTTRHSFWSVVIGGAFFWMSLYGCNQAQVQRAISCPTVTKSQIAMILNLFGLIAFITLCCMIGIVMFAFYSDCHPITFNSLISKTDQLVPLFVMDILGHLQGIPGIFISCIFSGSLSSLSSGLNALGAVIPHDLIGPFCCKKLPDKGMAILSRVIVIICGLLAIALAFLVSQLGGVLQASYTTYSILNGPTFGLFVLGMFFPWANSWGAVVGCFSSLAFMCWVGFGAFVNAVRTSTPLPTSIAGCNWNVTTTMTPITSTTATTMTSSIEPGGSSDLFLPLYRLSYLYYTPTAMAVVIIVGMLVSLLTCCRDPKTMDPRLICPLFDRLFPCMPEMILRPLRCGVNHRPREHIPHKMPQESTPHKMHSESSLHKTPLDSTPPIPMKSPSPGDIEVKGNTETIPPRGTAFINLSFDTEAESAEQI
ncbi:sodium-coupled monocarboxylate transporter 1-like [Haliotis asinina]|uniref:sodium-coupled monocarboxylate transporter 1-like n=1 Tax=Haliotis asinina TaxID=109174 RepID=UPI0035324A9A